jgi:hypothetical protein
MKETFEQSIERIKRQTAAIEAVPKSERRKLAWAFRVMSPIRRQLTKKTI